MKKDIIQIMLNNVIDEGLNITYHSAIEIKTYIDNLESLLKSKDELLMEAYESIVKNKTYQEPEDGIDICTFCDEWVGCGDRHDDNCIVNKAQDYISKES